MNGGYTNSLNSSQPNAIINTHRTEVLAIANKTLMRGDQGISSLQDLEEEVRSGSKE